jgi:serine protease
MDIHFMVDFHGIKIVTATELISQVGHQSIFWGCLISTTRMMKVSHSLLCSSPYFTGTIAAVSVNGVVGVAPGVKLFIVRVFDDRRTFVSSLVDAAYSCKAGGANVINMSLGGGGFSRAENTAFADLYTNHNILLVAAAGNFGNTPRGTVMQYPASYDSVVSVGAVDSNKELAIFSQRNDQVEMAAPGESVLSTVPMGTGDVQGNYAYESGTSMATPHVSGVAALIWSHNATKTASEVRAALQSTAEDLGVPGRDNEYGYGLVQAAAACSTLTGSSCTQFDPEPSGPSSGSATQQQSAAPSLSSAIPTNSWINAESLLVVASLFLLHTS